MVTLEQIRQLDARVHRAMELIGKLKEENTTLKSRLSEYQDRIEELEVLISNFKEDQSEIEQGITKVLSQLAAIDEGGASQAKEPHHPAREQKSTGASSEAHQAAGNNARVEPPRASSEMVEEAEEEEPEDLDKPEAELDIF